MYGALVQWENACLASKRSSVQVRYAPPTLKDRFTTIKGANKKISDEKEIEFKMSSKARMIMYPLLGVVVAFFLYTMFFMEKPAPQEPVNGTEPTTEQVQAETVETEGK